MNSHPLALASLLIASTLAAATWLESARLENPVWGCASAPATLADSSTPPVGPAGQTADTRGSRLSYDARTNQYIVAWKTDKTWPAAPSGPCRQLVVGSIDWSFVRTGLTLMHL